MTEQEITELRSRIVALEENAGDIRRGLNLALDEIIGTNDILNTLTQRVENNTQTIRELTLTVSQMAESMTILRQTQQTTTDRFVETFTRFTEQSVDDRQAFQAEIRRIWEYLLLQHPNGRGQGGEG